MPPADWAITRYSTVSLDDVLRGNETHPESEPGSIVVYIPIVRVSRLATAAPHAAPAPSPAALSLAQAATNAPTRSAAMLRLVIITLRAGVHRCCRASGTVT